MAWTTPRTWTTSEVVTAAMMNTHVRDNLNELRTAHVARMYQAAALSHTATGAWQLVTWDTSDYDTDGFVVLASEWFVVPAGFGGVYRIHALAQFANVNAGWRGLRIAKNETYATRTPNGVGTVLEEVQVASTSGTGAHTPVVDWQGPLVAGDHITIEADQNSGANLAFFPGRSSLAASLLFLGG